MFWQLLWCVAIMCEPGQMKTDIGITAGYTKEQCVAEAKKRLEQQPNTMFICRESKPAATRANFDSLIDAVKNGKPLPPPIEEAETIFIGPKTLSY